ncbi:MAG: sulfite exporter TauE/SafE family protein, partial [Candidatus Eremiobacteraeota bacterium]|nr:sulfite exporter TauE/SafE family protein [Candidatus Eremiobacteraeota bacterium]
MTHTAAALNLWLFILAFAVSVFGSLVGLGGGFILVPLLRLLFGLPPAITAGSSLALVVTNNAMASIAYFRQRRIHLETGLLIAAGGLPGSIVGALAVRTMSTRVFDWLLAILTIGVAVDMLVYGRARAQKSHRPAVTSPAKRISTAGLGVVVGLLSGLFGAGGGIVLVSVLFYFTDLSPHEVTATTQFA